MVRRKIIAALDDHDYEQLELLARMAKIKAARVVAPDHQGAPRRTEAERGYPADAADADTCRCRARR